MSQYPQTINNFVNKTGTDNIASSDPNNAFDGIESIQGLIGALGEPQTWSTTLMTLIRRYKRGMYIDVTAGILTVRSGEAVLENTDGAKFAFRRNTGDVALGAGNIDVGTLAATTYYIYATASGAATTTPLMFSTDALAPSGIGTAPYRRIGWFENTAVASLAVTYAGEYDAEMTEKIINISYRQIEGSATGTGLLPFDNSIPQITEGNEFMRLLHAPSSAANKLKIDVNCYASHNVPSEPIQAALFKLGTADALRSGLVEGAAAPSQPSLISFTHYMPAAVTSLITFTVRIGSPDAGTLSFNSPFYHNGKVASSITVTEIAS